jgi:hypothetical protein
LIDLVNLLCVDEVFDAQANGDDDDDQDNKIDEVSTTYRPTEINVAGGCEVGRVDITMLDLLFGRVNLLVGQAKVFADEGGSGIIGHDARVMNCHIIRVILALVCKHCSA